MIEKVSGKQAQILEFLRQFIDEKDYPPSIRDIQEGCGISSTSVVDYNLRKLEEKGFIRRDREVSRGIEVLGARGRRPTAPLRATPRARYPRDSASAPAEAESPDRWR